MHTSTNRQIRALDWDLHPSCVDAGREKADGIVFLAMQEERPSSRDDGGVSWVFSSCGASIIFLTRHDGELREPLVWC